jgi:hypothetical protein
MTNDQILSAAKQVFFDMFHQSGQWFFDYLGTEEENTQSTQTNWEEFEERLIERLSGEKEEEEIGDQKISDNLSFWLDSGSERCYTEKCKEN